MKLFQDCEIHRWHLRGQTAVAIVGSRRATSEELAALAAEFRDSFGDRHVPIYFSAEGWQDMAPQPDADAKPAKPARKPKEAE